MALASSTRNQRGAERQHVGAVVLARIARQRLVGAHGGSRAGDLVRGDRRAEAGAVDHDRRIHLFARHQPRNLGGNVRIVHRIGALGADIEHAQPSLPQVVAQCGLQRHAGMIAADRHRLDVGNRRETIKARLGHAAQHGDAPRLERVGRERRDVPARLQRHGDTDVERPRVGLSDDVERFHIVTVLLRLVHVRCRPMTSATHRPDRSGRTVGAHRGARTGNPPRFARWTNPSYLRPQGRVPLSRRSHSRHAGPRHDRLHGLFQLRLRHDARQARCASRRISTSASKAAT